MKDIVKLIKEEWEIAIFSGVVIILFLWGVLSWLDSGERVISLPGLLIEEESAELLTENALDFLKGHETTEISGVKPFALPSWAHAEFPKPKPKPAPKPVVKAPEPVVAAPEPEPAPEPEAPKEAPKPEPRAPVPVVAKLYFSEYQEMGDGTLVALMELSRGEVSQMLSLGKGESDYGIMVVNIENRAVIVQDAKRRRLRLRKEDEEKVWAVMEP